MDIKNKEKTFKKTTNVYHIHMNIENNKCLSVKFNGGGWLFPFYFGVGKHLQEHLDVQSNNIRFMGVSAGSVVATMIIYNTNLHNVLEDVLSHYHPMKYNPFLIKTYLLKTLEKYIPEQDVNKVHGRLEIGVSKLDIYQMRWLPKVISTFPDRYTCIEAIRASCHIPIISGILPYYIDGCGYYDGELSYKTECNCIEVGIKPEATTINPGIKLPEVWKYYPVDPYISRLLFKLGYLRSKEFFKTATLRDLADLENIMDVINFSLRTSHITYWRVLRTMLIYLPGLTPLTILVFFTLKKIWKVRKLFS